MPNSRHTSVMASPSNRRATKRRRSSITELAFHGIYTSRRTKAESVTHVSGTKCHLCVGPLSSPLYPIIRIDSKNNEQPNSGGHIMGDLCEVSAQVALLLELPQIKLWFPTPTQFPGRHRCRV